MSSHRPAYRIQTRRLLVRCWTPEDTPRLHQAVEHSLEHLRPWIPWVRYEPLTLEARETEVRRFRAWFDLDQDYLYGIFDREEAAVIGGTGLHTRVGAGAREIGYWIGLAHIGQGYATEVSGALTKVGFEIDGLDRIEIHCDPENEASAAVARKLGYRHEGTLRRRYHAPDGQYRDTMMWTLFRDQYPESPAASMPITAWDCMGRVLLEP